MIPLHGRVPKGYLPLATVAVTLACAAGFLHQAALSDAALEALVARDGLIPSRTLRLLRTAPVPVDGWLRPVLVHPFLHGGLLHLASNVVFLLAFGRGVEARLGHGRLLLVFALGSLAAAAAHVAFNPGSTLPMVGASGAISGIMGAYLVLYPFSRITTLIPIVIIPVLVPLPAFLFVGLWLTLQILAVTATPDGGEAGVAWWAHLGGFAVGPLLALALDRGRPPPDPRGRPATE